MDTSQSKNSTNMNAEAVLAAALKILGIYILYSAILQSSNLLRAMFTLAMMTTNSRSFTTQWGTIATSVMGTGMAAGLAIVLIRHGGRAAHWLAVRPDLNLRAGSPTQQWYAGSLIFIGVWILVIQFPGSLNLLAWSIIQTLDLTQYPGRREPALYFIVSALHSGTALVLGLGLIFGARRLGNGLYRMSGASRDASTSADTQ